MFPGRVRLAALLRLVVVFTTVPLALFAAWLIWTSWRGQQTQVYRQNLDLARAVSVAVDQEVDTAIASLQALSAVAPLESTDPLVIHAFATRMLPLHPGWRSIRLIDANRRVIVNTAVPPGSPTVLLSRDWVDDALSSGRPSVSRLRRDPATGEYVISIGIPVTGHGGAAFVLGARISASRFSDILLRQNAPPGGVLTLVDQTPVAIARTTNEDRFRGKPPSADFQAELRAGVNTWRSVTLEGMTAYAAWNRSQLTGWTVGVAVPAESIDRPIRRSLIALSAVGLVVGGLGIALAASIGRRILRAHRHAAEAAQALARGLPVDPIASRIADIRELSDSLAEAAAVLKQRLEERDAAQRQADSQRAALLEREQAARRAAESLNRAKDEFMATVSHELRTPLNAIFGWVAMLKGDMLDAAARARAIEVIDRNVRAQAQLIEDLLDMSRVVRGTVRLDMQRVDLANVLDSALDVVRPAASARHVTVASHAQSGAAIVLGDAARLQQVIWNLLSNAVKFTTAGGRVDVTLTREDGDAVLRVTDTGAGISPSFLPHVFDRFTQEEADVRRPHPGLGIGLSLVRDLTELHGGTVTAESEGKDRGSTFTVRLPAMDGAAPAADTDPATAEPRPTGTLLQGQRVLVVDDDADAREMLAMALRQAGATVDSAASVDEAMMRIDRNVPHTIISDIAMPQRTGYDFVRYVRADPQLASLPMIAVTAYARREDREEALRYGFDAHVSKPVDPQTLVATVAGVSRRA